MAIGTMTMILANVGLSIFNNWAGSRQSQQIAAKREKFERAAREGQRDRMLQTIREGQQLTLELEEQKHKERLFELNNQFDNLIKELAYSAAIEHWPLTTLPIVMKNQALGCILTNQEEKVALHSILTSSNCHEFNEYVLPKIESALEDYCNVNWNSLTGSPILFYSGAWKFNEAPSNIQVDSLKASLSNLPTLLITPFFRPQDHKLVFQVHVWGVGYNNSDQFSVPELDPSKEPNSTAKKKSSENGIRLQRDYTDRLNWLAEEGLIEEAVEDLVPYLQCLIGYIADTYFWSAFGLTPQLPRLLNDNTINTDGMKYLVDDSFNYYNDLLENGKKHLNSNPFISNNLIPLLDGMSYFLSQDGKRRELEIVFFDYCRTKKKTESKSVSELIDSVFWDLSDYQFINMVIKYANNINISDYSQLKPILELLDSINYDFSILDVKDIPHLESLYENGNAVAAYRLGEIYEYGMRVKIDEKKAKLYYKDSANKGFLFGKIKTGEIQYNDIPYNVEKILLTMNILQLDILFSDTFLKKTEYFPSEINAVIERLTKTIMSNMKTGRAYSHSGLLYNMAALKIKVKDFKTAKAMLELANKLGYTKYLKID